MWRGRSGNETGMVACDRMKSTENNANYTFNCYNCDYYRNYLDFLNFFFSVFFLCGGGGWAGGPDLFLFTGGLAEVVPKIEFFRVLFAPFLIVLKTGYFS